MRDRWFVDWHALRVRGRLTHAGYQRPILPDRLPVLPIAFVLASNQDQVQDHVVARWVVLTADPTEGRGRRSSRLAAPERIPTPSTSVHAHPGHHSVRPPIHTL